MMHDLVRRGTPATLLYSVRSLEEAAFLGELAALASKGNEATEGRPGGTDGGASGSEQPKYRVAAAVTGPLHQSAHEPASYHRGRLSSDVILQAAPHAAACDVYMCGPPAFMAAMEEQLLAVGVAEQRLHTESFSF
jgi:ferredoxin-NADP reductase